MIKPKKNKFIIAFLNLYLRLILKKNFGEFILEELPKLDKNKSTLLIGNHFSWWDGIFINEINRLNFKKDIYVLMLEDQLKQNKILSKAGAFSIERKSRDMIESFNYCKDLLKKPNSLLLFYPQGEITSIHQEEVTFQKGLTKLLNDSVQLVFYVCLPDYFSKSKPNLYFYFHIPTLQLSGPITQIQDKFNHFYRDCRRKQALKKT